MRVRSGYRCWKVVAKGIPSTGWAQGVAGETITLHIITKSLPTEDTIRKVIEETPALHGFRVTAIKSIEDIYVPSCIDLEAKPEHKSYKLIEDAKKGEMLFFDSNGRCYVIEDDC